jgi:hypothetical protein
MLERVVIPSRSPRADRRALMVPGTDPKRTLAHGTPPQATAPDDSSQSEPSVSAVNHLSVLPWLARHLRNSPKHIQQGLTFRTSVGLVLSGSRHAKPKAYASRVTPRLEQPSVVRFR